MHNGEYVCKYVHFYKTEIRDINLPFSFGKPSAIIRIEKFRNPHKKIPSLNFLQREYISLFVPKKEF